MPAPSLDLLAESHKPDGSRPATHKTAGPHQTPRTDSFFTNVQWSSDGTTLFTTSSENRLCTYVLPEDLLEPKDEPIELTPHGTLVLPGPLGPIAPSPYWSVTESYTQLVLTSSREHPIHLYYPFQSLSSSSQSDQRPLASYFLIDPLTEAYTPVTSLLWPGSSGGNHFIAGSNSLISLFDITRPGESAYTHSEPTCTIPTYQKSSKRTRVGLHGAISALALQNPSSSYGISGAGLVAAGTRTRGLGLYDLNRAGECTASWKLSASQDGNGVMQVLWSPCGRYLVVNERSTTSLLVYDIRETHSLLARLTGRRGGKTKQRLNCDVYAGSGGGFEVWSGTGDGGVVVWENVGLSSGDDIKPSWERKGLHEPKPGEPVSAVSAAAMHLAGSVVATCSGSWKFVDDDDSDSESDDDEDSSSTKSDSDSNADLDEKTDADSSHNHDGDETHSQGSSSAASTAPSTVTRQLKPKRGLVTGETSLKIWSICMPLPERPAVAS
ncbi:hypothetical protein V8F06_005601 [Rhypophila decipiens]